MVPYASDPRWKVVLQRNNTHHRFVSATAGMMFARLQRSLASDPSPENLQTCIAQAHAFFTKYEIVMKDELYRLFG